MYRLLLLFLMVTASAALGGWVVKPKAQVDSAIVSHSRPEATQQAGMAIYFIGGQACAACHPQQYEHWRNSHHDLAMQEANEQTVLGDFDQARFDYFGLTSTFFKRDGTFMVRTDGPDGELHDYEVTYTFGVTPLQQYLIAFPGGRLQALSIAWDARPQSQGGQRWFHLYPDERIGHDDILHWTAPEQNWNYMCAACHSTDLQKNYDSQSQSYQSTWAEINVSCEACHGPGSRHLAWANALQEGKSPDMEANKGLSVALQDRRDLQWMMDAATGNAHRNVPRVTDTEIQMCARCHSRRGVIAKDYAYGQPLLDTHLPALLDRGLYHIDGQIQGEVYEYGSFLQSKMYHQGVTCSDCHEPHSLQLRAPGQKVCWQCHLQTKYEATSHHFHPAGSTGANCLGCHMPTTTYMRIDPRHDHSLRIPRPELSVTLGPPNACTMCHVDQNAEWAAAQVLQWYGRHPVGYQTYAAALQAGRSGQPGAEAALLELATEASLPQIARATVISQLRMYLGPASFDVIRHGLRDSDPGVRRAALSTLEAVAVQDRLPLAAPLLSDPIRAVRIEAARVLAAVPPQATNPEQRSALEHAIREYVAAQEANADRPEAHLNLGWLYAQRGQLPAAEAAYRMALRLRPTFVPGHVNLADLYRLQGQEQKGEQVLREGLSLVPQDAALQHTLGLVLVRQQRMRDAISLLQQAATLAPDNAHYSYVYAVALHSTGRSRQAIGILEQTLGRHPYDRDSLVALATFHRDLGAWEPALAYAERLVAVAPHDPAAQQLLQQLRARR
jgi:tetratricopeptide (TPR) repeat protein